MASHPPRTLRLSMPQWQAGIAEDGGGNPGYRAGTALLERLAPRMPHDHIEAAVSVDLKEHDLQIVDGIYALPQIIAQLRSAREIIERHSPDRIVTLGGDCSVDVAPFDYLNRRYDGDLAVLWLDAHADWSTTADHTHFNAMAVRALVGESIDQVNAELTRPIHRSQLAYVGIRDGITSSDPARVHVPVPFANISVEDALAGPDATLGWLRSTGHRQVAIHLDVDVMTEFNITEGLTPEAVAAVIAATDTEFNVVGLGIAEYVPRGARTLERLLNGFPLLS
jgi:arginase